MLPIVLKEHVCLGEISFMECNLFAVIEAFEFLLNLFVSFPNISSGRTKIDEEINITFERGY